MSIRNELTMIYLDNNATTPIAPEVLEAMMPYLTTEWGNPSSSYRFGAKLKSVIENARAQVAELIGARQGEVVFTSCGTESNNAAIHAALKGTGKRHIVTSAVEHSSVLNYCKLLEGEGYRVTCLPVDREGLLKLADVENAITDDTAVVSLMWANNETGVLFPVKEIAVLCKSKGVLYHCDAVQAVGKVEIDLKKIPIDYLSITGHKIHAPKGIGALFVRRKLPFSPLVCGGHQERGRRGGTENVALVVGIGRSAILAREHLSDYERSVRLFRDKFESGILTSIPNTELNGHKTKRLANTLNISFLGIDSEALLLLLDQQGICASSGAACLADSEESSHVVAAMRQNSVRTRNSLRFSLGFNSTKEELEIALKNIQVAVSHLQC